MDAVVVEHDAAAFIQSALNQMVRGVKDRRSGFHIITVASVYEGLPQLRSVVMRGCVAARAEVVFHTDRRSPKFKALLAEPHAAIMAYDASAKLQLRLEGVVTLYADGEKTRQVWAGMSASSRAGYRIDCNPGDDLADGVFSAELVHNEADAERNFAICVLTFSKADVLHLKASGHQRAKAAFGADGVLQTARWVAA